MVTRFGLFAVLAVAGCASAMSPGSDRPPEASALSPSSWSIQTVQVDGRSTDVADGDVTLVFSKGSMSILPGLNNHRFSVVFGKDDQSLEVTDVAPVAGVGTDDPSLVAIEAFADGLRVGTKLSVQRTTQGVLMMAGGSLHLTAMRN